MIRSILVLGFCLQCYSLSAHDTLEGYWHGQIDGQKNIGLEFLKTNEGWAVNFYDLDIRCMQFGAEDVSIENDAIGFKLKLLNATISGTYNTIDKALALQWHSNGQALPITIKKAAIPLQVKERKSLVDKGMNPRAPLELGQFAFLLGEFHGYENQVGPAGKPSMNMTVWKTDWILEGSAIQNESSGYVMIDSLNRGPRIQFGQDTRIYNARENQWKHTYTDASGMVLHIIWKWEDGALVSEPVSWGGSVNIIKFKDIKPDSFTWTLDSSTDNGNTWQKEVRIMKNYRVH